MENNEVFALFVADYEATTLIGVYSSEKDVAAAFVPDVKEMVESEWTENDALDSYLVQKLEMNITYDEQYAPFTDYAGEIYHKYKDQF